MRLGLLALAANLAFGTTANAQVAEVAPIERQFKGMTGRNITVGIFASMKPDCTPGPLPVIRLESPPSHGQVTVRQQKIRITNRQECLAAEIPAFVAVYRSRADFSGTDELTLEINSGKGKITRQKIKVRVEDSGSGRI
jgi:hypothetical protein